MQISWGKIIGYSLLTLVLLNVLHAFFLYQKKYEPTTISLTVETDFDSYTWFTVQPKYSDSVHKTKAEHVPPNIKTTTKTVIDYPEGLQFLGLYWSNSLGGTFSISNVSITSKGKTRNFENLEKFINYSSTNVTPKSSKKVITATSNEQANGWLMLNLEGFEKTAKTKQFKPLGWVANTLLFITMCFIGWFYGKSIKIQLGNLNVKGNWAYKTRTYVFYLWMFLLPFWLIVSHILLAVSLALVIVHIIVEREKFQFWQLKNCMPLFVLFLAIMVLNVLFHTENIGNDFGDYSYFLLAPFLFLGLQREEMCNIFKVFQLAVGMYVFLLIVAILERYLQLSANYSFSSFFFETVEQYWHTSYLAGVIVIALLFEFQHKKFDIKLMFISLAAFIFMYLSQARLPLLIGLILIVGLTILQLPRKLRRLYIFFGILVTLVSIGFIYTSSEIRERITTVFLVNDTQKQDARPELWKKTLQISERNLFSGIGADKIRDVLSENLETESDIKLRRYNAHNQYLEYLLAYGIIVPILLLLVLGTPMVLGFKSTTVFVVYFSIVMLVESYFSRQAGVVVFGLFYCFFILYDSKSKQHISASSQQ